MTERRLVPDRTFDSLPVFCRETHTHTQFFQSFVSSADLSIDRSTIPYNRSLVSRRPLHRHGPSAVFKASPRDDQVTDPIYLQSRDTDRNVVAARFEIFSNTRFTSRDLAAIDITWLVTDLVTANGNSAGWPEIENPKRRRSRTLRLWLMPHITERIKNLTDK